MKILVTGATGQVGYDIVKEFEKRKVDVIGIGSKDCDITSKEAVQATLSKIQPDVVIHSAGYTAVDQAEEDEENCFRVNATGTKNIAKACQERGIVLLYISTDYVFDGEGTMPWKTDSPRNPTSVYGRSKYEGERAVQEYVQNYFIVRISWVYGVHGKNFVKAVLKKAETCNEITVVADQIGSPTYTVDIAKTIADLVISEKYGIYHVANEGYCSWYEFACAIFEKLHKPITVIPVSSDAYVVKAKRPLNSRLDKSDLDKTMIARLPDWEDALGRFLEEYIEGEK